MKSCSSAKSTISSYFSCIFFLGIARSAPLKNIFSYYFRIIILDGQIPSLNANLICAAFAFGSFFTTEVFINSNKHFSTGKR